MKKLFQIVMVSVLFWSCQSKINTADIAKINGYWEIEKVILPDGEKKDYSINETYDFFEIKNNVGFRQKVMPQLDGTFQTNELSEKVTVLFKDGKVFLQYETPYAKWQEELKVISDAEMVLLNVENKEYHYKKTTAINLTGDVKKIE